MRRISRLERSIGRLQPRTTSSLPAPYLCSNCIRRAPFSTSRRNTAKLSFAERLERKLWKQDAPISKEDPYGGKSLLAKTKEPIKDGEGEKTEVQAQEVEEPSSIWHESTTRIAIAEADGEDEHYVPAETADDLIEVGGLKPDYWETWDKKHPYHAFMPAERETNEEIVTAALHRAMVEVLTATELGRKLTGVQMIPQHGEDLTDYVQMTPSATGAALRFTEKASPHKIMKAFGKETPPLPRPSISPSINQSGPKGRNAATESVEKTQGETLLKESDKYVVAKPTDTQREYGWKPYACPQCAMRFTIHPSVKGHLKAKHSGVDSGPVEPSMDPTTYPESVKRRVRLVAKPGVDDTKDKFAPTESEEDVAADRSTVDPLHPEPEAAPVPDETAVKENPIESEKDVAADRSTIDPLHSTGLNDTTGMTYAEISAYWDPSWLQISLSDSATKFFIIKRMTQLTGIRLSDALIASPNTASALLTHYITVPKPRKLAEELKNKDNLLELPNVRVMPRRITPVDKEVEVGRWKVIERELVERGLPVFGRG